MPNPITVQMDERTRGKPHTVTMCPPSCNYPIMGIPWEVIPHADCRISIQEMDFLGNHMQLAEMEADRETEVRFTVEWPTVFVVIMIEGFFRFYRDGKLVAYAIGGTLYMTYNPSTDFLMRASEGKHSVMVVAVQRDWLLTAERVYPELGELVGCLREDRREVAVLPMCRMGQPLADLWDGMRVARSNPFRRRAELAVHGAELIDIYHGQLEKGNFLKGQLSPDTANLIFMYVERHFASESHMTTAKIARHADISPWKVREYAKLLFGKSLHKHVMDMRMAKAMQLLGETDVPVGAVGLMVGFSSDSHFYEIFRRYCGISPSAFRENHKKT